MRNRFLFFCCMVFILLVFISFRGCWRLYITETGDDVASIPEWSNLQTLSIKWKDSVLKKSIIIDRMPHERRFITLGIPEKNSKYNIWILLNPSYKPYYKQLPEGDYQIDVPTLIKAISTGEVHPYVAKELALHVELREKNKQRKHE